MTDLTARVAAASRGPRLRGLLPRLRTQRWWRVLATVMLVPVVVFSSPTQAAAASIPWHTLEFNVPTLPVIGDNVPGSLDTIDCTFSLANLGGYAISQSTGECYGLADVTPGWTQSGEAGSTYTIRVKGTAANGSVCSGSTTSTLAPHPANGTLRVAGTIAPDDFSVSPEDCHITEVCLVLPHAFGDLCQATDIPPAGAPEPPSSACIHGFPRVTVRVVDHETVYNGSTPLGAYQSLVADVIVPQNVPTTVTWGVTTREPNGTVRYTSTANGNPVVLINRRFYAFAGGTAMSIPPGIGVQLYAYPEPTNWNTQGSQSASGQVPTSAPTSPTHAFHGTSMAEHCRFYYGPRSVDFPGTDIDNPNELNAPPPEDPAPVLDPEPELPSTDPPVDPDTDSSLDWLWALLHTIWTALVNGFSAVVSAIKGLVTGIVDGIVAGVQALFVPEDDFFDRKVASVDDAMAGSTVDNYVQVFDGLAPAGSEGCSGPTVSVPFGPGSFTPLNACDGVMAQAASISKTVIGVGFAVTAFFAVLRILGSGFGWNPTPSGGVQ